MTAESQGWHLKRLLSFTKNRLANRPNRPRDPLLRGYLASLGFVWPEPEEDSESIATTEDEGSDTESSDGEEGPVVPVVANGGGDETTAPAPSVPLAPSGGIPGVVRGPNVFRFLGYH